MTVWYSAILLVMLVVFAAITAQGLHEAIYRSVDIDLEARVNGLAQFLQIQAPRYPRERLPHQIGEHIVRPGGEMVQVADNAGNWIFRSESITSLHLDAIDKTGNGHPVTLMVQGAPFRVRSAAVRVNSEIYYVRFATALEPSYLALDGFRKLALALIPVMVLAAAAGGYWLSRRAMRPVGKIIEDARSISAQSLSRRLAVPEPRDELRLLSLTLNDLIQRLEASFQRIARFTSDASHELRAPVALIRGTAEVALMDSRDPDAYRAALTDILAESERTSRLIEDLMTLARADAGAPALSMTEIHLDGPLEHACNYGRKLAAAKHIRFRAIVARATPAVLGAPGALERLFLILIDNAVKYTPSRGSVDVELAAADSAVVVTVSDSGIGIAPDDLEHIFERFYRADKARQRDSGGAGLGLSIARWIADIHGATIDVESTAGQGSRFRVSFPLVGGAGASEALPKQSAVMRPQNELPSGAVSQTEPQPRGSGLLRFNVRRTVF
jgi:heavy metal sensor kinase